MSYNATGYYGATTGTNDTYATQGYTTAVTGVDAWADSAYVYGIKLYWGSTNHLFGVTPNGTMVDPSLDATGSSICKVRIYVDGTGVLRGVSLYLHPSGSPYILGYMGTVNTLVYNDIDDALTNLGTYYDNVGGIPTMVGIKFYYTGPLVPEPNERLSCSPLHRLCMAELGWPALATLAHTAVVANSFMRVGKLRRRLAIQAPSCDPPLTTSPSDAQLWYRTFRAQENCKEMFLVYLPSILIASTLGYHVFGKWAPRVVGTLAFAGAFFRYKYLNAYIEDSDKREKPFSYATACMKPVFFLAVVSSGYMVGKELYQAALKHHKSIKASEDDE